MSQKSSVEKVLISGKLSENEEIYLLKDESTDEYFLKRSVHGWKKISEMQKAWDLLLTHKYYVKEFVVPLIYFILTTNPTQFDSVFEFLYQNNFIMIEQDEQ